MRRSDVDQSSTRPQSTALSVRSALSGHWPEYLIEGWALGSFMLLGGLLVTAFESPKSPVLTEIPNAKVRIVFLAFAVGVALALLIQSPWGKRSGAHMNPAITLAFLSLGKIKRVDAVFYIIAQSIGGILGVVAVAFVAGSRFTDPPVQYAATLPGSTGELVAFAAESTISFVLMAAILAFVASPRLIRFTGIAVGCLVTFFIIVESPFSGTSMNPARTLASAVPLMMWQHLWLYILGPTFGMWLAAQFHLYISDRRVRGCAKLLHPRDVRCIHCDYCPPTKTDRSCGRAHGN